MWVETSAVSRCYVREGNRLKIQRAVIDAVDFLGFEIFGLQDGIHEIDVVLTLRRENEKRPHGRKPTGF
jgi:hypothetical protein